MWRKTNLIWENLYSLKEAEVILLGIPFDSTCTEIPGARFAPNRIREAFQTHISCYDKELGDLSEVKIHDAGNLEAMHGNIQGMHKLIYDSVKEILEENPKARLIILGGEHSITYPIVKALAEKKKFNYLCYDGHLDLWNENQGIKLSHECVNRRVFELFGNIEIRGARSDEKENFDFARKLRPVKDPLYLSIDTDVLENVPVQCPAAGGMKIEELWAGIKKRKIIACDVVEYNPLIGETMIVPELVKKLILKLSKTK